MRTLDQWVAENASWLSKDIECHLEDLDKDSCLRKIMSSIRQWHVKALLPIQKGDGIWCITPIEGFITFGKYYEVLDVREQENRVVIKDDRGLEGWYNFTRFTKL